VFCLSGTLPLTALTKTAFFSSLSSDLTLDSSLMPSLDWRRSMRDMHVRIASTNLALCSFWSLGTLLSP
jgi:hypothetical protein